MASGWFCGRKRMLVARGSTVLHSDTCSMYSTSGNIFVAFEKTRTATAMHPKILFIERPCKQASVVLNSRSAPIRD